VAGWPLRLWAASIALADGFGVARWHAQPVAGEGFAQRRPGGAQLGRGRVHRAEAFGELEGAFGLGAVGEEPAGLPAHPPLQRRQAPLLERGGEGVAVDAELESPALVGRCARSDS
jgi:hypothetical protein